MRNRSFTFFGVLAAILATALYLVLNQSFDIAWYWNWLIAVSVIAFGFYGYDKISAKAGAGRIPELLLHLIALAGGFAGALLGMVIFHHKSNYRAHPLFVPVILAGGLLWAALIYYLRAGTL